MAHPSQIIEKYSQPCLSNVVVATVLPSVLSELHITPTSHCVLACGMCVTMRVNRRRNHTVRATMGYERAGMNVSNQHREYTLAHIMLAI